MLHLRDRAFDLMFDLMQSVQCILTPSSKTHHVRTLYGISTACLVFKLGFFVNMAEKSFQYFLRATSI